MRDPMEVVGVIFSSGFSLLVLYAGWLGVRWARRKLEPPGSPAGMELEMLHERLARLEETELRLAEVEERLDFAERMLTRPEADGALPRGVER